MGRGSLAALLFTAVSGTVLAQPSVVDIGYLALRPPRTTPLTLLDPPIADEGVQGARVALADNQTTGRFTKQDYALHEAVRPDEDGVLAAAREMLAAGRRMVVADLPAALLGRVAALPEADGAMFLNASTSDDGLRGSGCSPRVLHLAPSHAMLADALMQFLAVKRWRKAFRKRLGESRDIGAFVGFRRGRFFTATVLFVLMIRLPFPLEGNGTLA